MSSPARWSEEEVRLRQAICRVGKLAYDRSYIVGADGNISAKMSDGTILITPTGAMKGFLEPQHVAHVDPATGKALDTGPKPSSEVGIHLVDRSDEGLAPRLGAEVAEQVVLGDVHGRRPVLAEGRDGVVGQLAAHEDGEIGTVDRASER